MEVGGCRKQVPILASCHRRPSPSWSPGPPQQSKLLTSLTGATWGQSADEGGSQPDREQKSAPMARTAPDTQSRWLRARSALFLGLFTLLSD